MLNANNANSYLQYEGLSYVKVLTVFSESCK